MSIVNFANMSKLILNLILLTLPLSTKAQSMMAEDFYVSAFNEMIDMLSGKDSLSIKRATFLAEWAYCEANLDYNTDFCDEIERASNYIRLFYNLNNLKSYKNRKTNGNQRLFFPSSFRQWV